MAFRAAFDILTSSDTDGALVDAMSPIYQKLLSVKGKPSESFIFTKIANVFQGLVREANVKNC